MPCDGANCTVGQSSNAGVDRLVVDPQGCAGVGDGVSDLPLGGPGDPLGVHGTEAVLGEAGSGCIDGKRALALPFDRRGRTEHQQNERLTITSNMIG